MNPDEARALLRKVVFVGSTALAYTLNALVRGDATTLGPDESAETQDELEQLVSDDKLPVEVLHAFRVAAQDAEFRYVLARRRLRREIAEHGVRAVGEVAQYDGATFDAFMDACDEHELAASDRLVGAVRTVTPHARESRPASRRSRRTGSASSDDPDLADLFRRCPRCGGALRPLLPSPHWRCDRCADALWERQVLHDVERVLDEAERITRESA